MLVEKEIYGSRMLLDTEDKGLSADLWRDGTREWECPDIIHTILEPGMTCLDIGANLGYYALMSARLVGPSGRVWAIEPATKSLEILEESAALNGYENIHTRALAIGAENGTGRFGIAPYSNLCAMEGTKAAGHAQEWVEVPLVTVDTLLEREGLTPQEIDFLRFDIEGFEVQLIKGAEACLTGMRKGSWIFGEFHTCHFDNPLEDLAPTIQAVLDAGFVPKHSVYFQTLPIFPAEDFAEAYCTGDFATYAPRLFLRKE